MLSFNIRIQLVWFLLLLEASKGFHNNTHIFYNCYLSIYIYIYIYIYICIGKRYYIYMGDNNSIHYCEALQQEVQHTSILIQYNINHERSEKTKASSKQQLSLLFI